MPRLFSRILTSVSIVTLVASSLLLGAPAQADRAATVSTKVFLSTGPGTAFNGSVFFAADDGVHGNELWKTDGTAAGTKLVKDFNVGNATSHSNPDQLTVVGNRLYIKQNGGADAGMLWYLDVGSTPKKLQYANGDPGNLTTAAVIGNRLIAFGYTYHDGFTIYSVANGSSVALELMPGLATGAHSDTPAVVNGYAYFAGMDTHNAGSSIYGGELYRTDGTPAGTTRVKNIASDVGGVHSSGPSGFRAGGNKVYFTADDGFKGRELWVSDGSSAGTKMVRDHRPGVASTDVSTSLAIGNVLYYVPNDYKTGPEIWRTDGTAAGTRLVKDISPGEAGHCCYQLFALGSKLGFTRGNELWASNGTAAGTTSLQTFAGVGYGPGEAVVVAGRAYLAAGWQKNGMVIWRTDGTKAGTFPLTAGSFDGYPDAPYGPFPSRVTRIGSKLIFTAQFRQSASSPYSANARRVLMIDTTKADLVRKMTVAPKVSGVTKGGNWISMSKGRWSVRADVVGYEWLLDGKVIKNETLSQLYLKPTWIGKKLQVRATAAGVGASAVTYSPPAIRITGDLTVTRQPSVTGVAKVGSTLRAVKPTFGQRSVALSYRWYAGGKAISGATNSSYKIATAHRGKNIQLKVTAKRDNYTTLVLKAPVTGKVIG